MSHMPLDTVVLIDDDSFDNKYHSRVISRSGLARHIRSFTMAEDALEWLARAHDSPVDLILLDVNMPRMDGFEFLETACRTLGPAFDTYSVVMLSTSMNAQDRKRAEAFPMVCGYVEKSLRRENFESIVASIAARRNARAIRSG